MSKSGKTNRKRIRSREVNNILDEVVAITNECVDKTTCSFDGTGLSASNENYADKRQKRFKEE